MISLPTTTLSYAQSIDGRIATVTGESKWISRKASLELSHKFRSDHDGLAVGIGTVLRDDPRLTCRIPGGRQPVKIIFDTKLRTPPGARLFESKTPVYILFGKDQKGEEISSRKKKLTERGAKLIPITEQQESLHLTSALRALADHGIESLYVEGGSRIITSFIKEHLADLIAVVSVPLFIGRGVEGIGNLEVTSLSEAIHPASVRWEILGTEGVCYMEMKKEPMQ